MTDVTFRLGKMLEITNTERDLLQRIAKELELQAKFGEPGWFKSYLEGHRHAHGIISDIMKRSHASS